ncbi:ribose-phosphate pyrophosphokinase [Candidatus Poribacteria bacterium]|nr:ribose-phosphate pyrophosphokinase [Candidatus Poribacteria bacterium]
MHKCKLFSERCRNPNFFQNFGRRITEFMTKELNANQKVFFTPERFAQEQAQRMESTRGRLLIAGCCSGSYLSTSVVERYKELLVEAGSGDEVLHIENIDYRFANSETCVRLDIHVGGYDVFLFQALRNPTLDYSVDGNYMTFLIAARTFREHGANHVTAVLPYLAYGRQDKPTKFMREPTTAKLMADLSIEAGVDRLITWDAHCDQIRGFYGSIPANMLDPLTLFIEEFRCFQGREDVIAVAPDAGASNLITHFGRALNLKCAIASKERPRPDEVIISEIIGDFTGKKVAIILDDEISTGGTLYELIKKLVEEKGIEEIHLGASHSLCMERARERFVALHADYHLKEVVVTNSIPQTDEFLALPFFSVRCLSDTLARTINRIHYNRSVSELFYRP